MSIIKYKSNDDINIAKLRELSYIDMYKCVNSCWYYIENLASNVWSENEAKNILAECYIENNDIEAALSVLDEVLISDRYNFDALKLIISYCMNDLDVYERKTIGTIAIMAYEKLSIEYARKGENVPIDMAVLLTVDEAGGGIFEDEVITVVDRERDVINVSREVAHIAVMYGNDKALEILNSNYGGLSDNHTFIKLKAYYNYICGNYGIACELIAPLDTETDDIFCATINMRLACIEYYEKLENGSRCADVEHFKLLKAITRLVESTAYNVKALLMAIEALFFAKEYERAAVLIERSEFTANSKVLMYLAAAKSNIGEEGEALVTFKLAHYVYRKYCDAGLNFTDNEIFIPHDGEFLAEDVEVLNRDVGAEIDEVIADALKQDSVDELSEVLAIAISRAYGVRDIDKISALICDNLSDNAIKKNIEFFKRLTYNFKIPNRIRADILYRIMLAYPKKYVACGFGKVVHFTKYLADTKLLDNEFRLKTYLFALSRKYIFHDTNYAYEYDVLFKKFDIMFPSNLKLNKRKYKLAALFASKMCFYYYPIYSDEMLCSEFGFDVDYFRSQFDEFINVNKQLLNDCEALCTKEFGFFDFKSRLERRSGDDPYLSQADIENLKNHPKVRFYDFTAGKSDVTDK